VNPACIARQLGRANTTMLFKHYAKWIEGADSGLEAGKFNRAFGTRFGPHLVPKEPKAN
jgi:integrase